MMSGPPAQTREDFLRGTTGGPLLPPPGPNLLEKGEDITVDDFFPITEDVSQISSPLPEREKIIDTKVSAPSLDTADVAATGVTPRERDGSFVPPRIPVSEEDIDRFLSCIARNAYYSEKFQRGTMSATFRVKSSLEVQYLRACISNMVADGKLLTNDDLNLTISRYNMFFQLHEFCGKVTPKPMIPPRPWNTPEELNLEDQFWNCDLGRLTDASSMVIQGMMIQFENKVSEIERLILDPKFSRGDVPS
jgi:hypothetical protein